MSQEEFKVLLDENEYSYKQDDKWLIIDDTNNHFILSDCHLEGLPEYIIFNNHGNVDLSWNNFKSIPKNIQFNNNGNLYISNNKNLEYLHENIIFNNHGNVDLSWNNLKRLPENIFFNNTGYILLNNNILKELPKNIYFGKNVTRINLKDNDNLKLKYYGNYFSKIKEFRFNIYKHFSNKYIIEKVIHNFNLNHNPYQTPNICLIKVLEDNDNKAYIGIKLPKNFLSITSWI